MKVLLTGATGFLGSYIIKDLTQNGHHVVAFARSSHNVRHLTSVRDKLLQQNGDQDDDDDDQKHTATSTVKFSIVQVCSIPVLSNSPLSNSPTLLSPLSTSSLHLLPPPLLPPPLLSLHLSISPLHLSSLHLLSPPPPSTSPLLSPPPPSTSPLSTSYSNLVSPCHVLYLHEQGDLSDEDSLVKCTKGIDIVVHAGAMMQFYPRSTAESQQMRHINVDGTRNLLHASMQTGVRRFIYISSTETIGPTKSDTTGPGASESDACCPAFEYGRTKVEAEAMLRQEAASSGPHGSDIEYMILRPTGLYGPGDRFAYYELLDMIHSGLLCFIPGSGKYRVMFTHVSDASHACRLAVEAPSSSRAINNTFIICPDQSMSFGECITTYSRILNRPSPCLHLPVSLVAVLIALLAPIFNYGKQRIFMFSTNTLRVSMQQNRVFSNKKIKQLLKFQPRYSMSEGVAQTVAFERKHNGLFPQRWYDPLSPLLLGLLMVTIVLAVLL
jgi:nucleoside-diphosphate-sugar epimerase